MSPGAWNLVLAVLVAVAGTAGAAVLRRRLPHGLNLLQRNLLSTNAGFFATLYTFFLSFAVVTLWTGYNDASEDMAHEATGAVTLCRVSRLLPDSEAFRRALASYVETVRDKEWPAMAQGRVSPEAAGRLERLWEEALRLHAAVPEDRATQLELLRGLKEMEGLRDARLDLADGSLLWPIWVLLHLGFAFTTVLLFHTNMEHGPTDAWYSAGMIGMMLLNILLIYEMDRPFAGILALPPDRFSEALTLIRSLAGS